MSKVYKLNRIDTIDTFEGVLRRMRGKEEMNALLTHLKIELQKSLKLMSKVFKLNRIDNIYTFEGFLRRKRGKEEMNVLLTHLKYDFQKCSK